MKKCPYCAEQIQDEAIKCRFCGSALNGGAAPAPPQQGGGAVIRQAAGAPVPAGQQTSRVVYEGTPSWKAWFWQYVLAGILMPVLVGLVWWSGATGAGAGALIGILMPVLVGLVWWGILQLSRRATRYRISDRTIDVEKGLFSRTIDTLQLWRVRDLEFRQTLLERMLGIARIIVFTADKTDPELVIVGLPASREIFDKLKDAAEIARQQRVVGLVE